MDYRIGYGEDAHRLAPDRPLWLGGLRLESPRGALAHSDGDVLLHALADALLAALALGDIGQYFPPSDPRYRDLASAEILAQVLARLRGSQPVEIVNIAATVTLDAPKLGPHRAAIAERTAALLGIDPKRVGLGFKTSEGLAPDHIQARVTVLLRLL